MCQLFETIKIIGGKTQNLYLHDERMNRSRHILFGTYDKLKLSDYISVPDNAKNGIVRCRVTYCKSIISTEFSLYSPAKTMMLKLVDAGALVYDHKYCDRGPLMALIDKNTADDILIFRNGCITDASYANIVFTDGRRWVTPDTPLLCGTMRELLLRKGVIKEERILANDIPRFTHFRLINAMLGADGPLLPVCNIINDSILESI
jgi:4-amino-4-deoxychorismate lyase